MKAVSIYSALLGQKKLKEQFVEDLRNLLHRDNKLCMIPGKLSFVKYSELRTWSIRQIAKKGDERRIENNRIKRTPRVYSNLC